MNEEQENEDALKQALSSYGLKQEISRLHKEIIPQQAPRQTQPAVIKQLVRTTMKAAAGLVFLIFGGLLYLYITASNESLYNGKYVPYKLSSTRGGDTTNSNVKIIFLEAQSDLQKNDPAKAIEKFQKVLDENRASAEKPLNDDAEFYMALAYLRNTETQKAIPLFQKIHDDKAHLYNDQVTGWYLFRLKVLALKH